MGRPQLELEVRAKGARSSGSADFCSIGNEIRIREDILEKFCYRRLSARAFDFLILAGAVAYADRKCKRRRSGGWQRDLRLSLPVHDVRFWDSKRLREALVEALVFLTGDNWSFEFRARLKSAEFLERQTTLPLEIAGPLVLPSSHGLDSLAHSLLLLKERPGVEVVRVLTKNAALGGAQKLGSALELQVPVRIGISGGEPTYRTRSFLFYSVAGVACSMVKGKVISIPENGQGSLGPSLVMDGNEWPYRGSHPGFTKRLSLLLKVVLGSDLYFEHPRIWQTKGEVLKAVQEKYGTFAWQQSRSCPRDQRDLQFDGPKIQCGICGGCVLRRMALDAAGLSSIEKYYWDDLKKSEMDDSLCKGAKRRSRANDIDIFLSNALAMKRLARLDESAVQNVRVRQVAYEISVATGAGREATMRNLIRLLQAHAEEWNSFVGALPKGSWFRRLCFV